MSAEKGTHDETNGTQLMKTTTNAINFSLPRDSYRRQFELKIFDEFEQYKLFFFSKKSPFQYFASMVMMQSSLRHWLYSFPTSYGSCRADFGLPAGR